MPSVRGPSSLYPPILKALSVDLYFRLWLIPEFSKHLYCSPPNLSHENVQGEIAPVLWDCFERGESLHVLLDLLASRNGTSAASQALGGLREGFVPSREELHAEFLKRVEVLEAQKVIPYGESFRPQDLMEGSTTGFLKVCLCQRKRNGVIV